MKDLRTVAEIIKELQGYEPESLVDLFEDENTEGLKILEPNSKREVGQIDICG